MDHKYTVFSREEFDRPSIITVAEIKEAERSDLPYLIRASLVYGAQPNGLPAGGEAKRIGRIEDLLVQALESESVTYAGRIMNQGVLLSAFYAKQPPTSPISIKVGLLKKLSIPLETSLDADWTWFEQKMEPSPTEREINLNRALHAKLNERGDLATKERVVDYTFYFLGPEMRAAFLNEVATQGYNLTGEGNWTTEEHPPQFGCQISFVSTVEPTVVAQHCVYLRAKALQFDGDFDGWACHITK